MSRPERHIFVCTQNRPAGHPKGSCGERGCPAVAEEFFREFESRFLWGKFAITTSHCIGPCRLGPNVLVYPDGVLYVNVTPRDVPTIIEEHLLKGRPVEQLLAPVEIW